MSRNRHFKKVGGKASLLDEQTQMAAQNLPDIT